MPQPTPSISAVTTASRLRSVRAQPPSFSSNRPEQSAAALQRLTACDLGRIMTAQNMNFDESVRACARLVAACFVLVLSGNAWAQSERQQAAEPSRDTSAPSTGPISGYMDFHFNKVEGADGIIDFHRFVLL